MGSTDQTLSHLTSDDHSQKRQSVVDDCSLFIFHAEITLRNDYTDVTKVQPLKWSGIFCKPSKEKMLRTLFDEQKFDLEDLAKFENFWKSAQWKKFRFLVLKINKNKIWTSFELDF